MYEKPFAMLMHPLLDKVAEVRVDEACLFRVLGEGQPLRNRRHALLGRDAARRVAGRASKNEEGDHGGKKETKRRVRTTYISTTHVHDNTPPPA